MLHAYDAGCQQAPTERAFFGVSAMLFVASAGVTVASCASMSSMGEIPMPGGWTMSTAWMPMCGQTWPEAAAAFLGMWMVMMAAMMLPSLTPALWHYRRTVGRTGEMRLGLLTVLAGAGYFSVWAVLGTAIFTAGATLAAALTRFPALALIVSPGGAVVVLLAGAFQFTAWKARHLACCRKGRDCGSAVAASPATAWLHGLRLGLHCGGSCAGPTAVLLVGGVMDLRTMALVTAAITAERLAPDGERIAQITGAIGIGAGLFLMAQAAGL